MKTLAVLPNWLGDLAMALPALERLREEADELVGLGSEANGRLLIGSGRLDRHLPHDRRGRDAGATGWWRTIRRLRREGFARAVVFPPSERAALLAFFSGAEERWGIEAPGRRLLLTRRRRGGPATGEHLVEQWWNLVGGETGAAPAPRLPLPGDRATAADSLLRELAGVDAFAALAPTATFGPTKRWPADRFAAIARHLRERHGLSTLLVAGGAEGERRLCASLADGRSVHSLAGRTDLPQLAALLARARLFVGNDSGPMHLAAAVGTPTVGIFTSTSPAWTAPRGPRARAVGAPDLFCAPCFLPRCPYQLECLEMVSVESVTAAADELLARDEGSAS